MTLYIIMYKIKDPLDDIIKYQNMQNLKLLFQELKMHFQFRNCIGTF